MTVAPLLALFRENPGIPFTDNVNSPSQRALSVALGALGLYVGSVFLKDYRRGWVGSFQAFRLQLAMGLVFCVPLAPGTTHCANE